MRYSERDAEARRKAEAVLARRKTQEKETLQERAKEREAIAEKTARLRELRLAKEAADAQPTSKTQAAATRWRKSSTRAQ
jgi:hypothetical protein